MKPIRTFSVVPRLPSKLEPLRKAAFNLRWSWDHETIELFRRLDSDLWESSGHNPVLMLGSVNQERLEAAAKDDSFVSHLRRVTEALDTYLTGESSWCQRTHIPGETPLVAYFSAEFGLTECVSIFAGGLGILAGDHLKSASDLGVPFAGVGLLYQQGYFRQYLNEAGWQQEAYEDNDFHSLPVAPALRPDGTPATIVVRYPSGPVTAKIWMAQVGRVPLYLLDTNIPANSRSEDRDITDQLYGGDGETRLRQEILLGIGGCRALEVLGIEPTVYHLNEGHSAFLGLERVARLMETKKLSFAEARELTRANSVFTTHTPVMAGHDYFPPDQIDRYLGDYPRRLGISRSAFLGLGRQNPADDKEHFCMTVLALRLAAAGNGVSKLHGRVTRKMWRGLWPGVPEDEVPIGHVTNGVHFRSWISYEMNQLYDRYLGPSWREEPADTALWKRAESIPAEELWRTHERRRERLVAFTRRRLRAQLLRRGASQTDVDGTEEVFDPDALTIGFARRFATYKRAALLLRDPERLGLLLSDPAHPIQILFAGKAHPRDNPGKELIQQIAALAGRKEFRRRIVFLEDYDMAVARYMVQGCDVWLNNPVRPMEASGTSGMKAAANGALNISTLDGWWDEAWQEADDNLIGWTIGRAEAYDDPARRDAIESEALYDLLAREVVPAFYDRGADRLPRRWIARMKASLGTLCHQFNTHRMVRQYTEEFYLIAHERLQRLSADNCAQARSLAAWLERVTRSWGEVRIEAGEGGEQVMQVGERLKVRAYVQLGPLTPDDVSVEMYYGRLDADGEIQEGISMRLDAAGPGDGGRYLYEGDAPACTRSGMHGYTIRVLPYQVEMSCAFEPGLITWAS
ncbi:MAG: alpha-glucan family phosphorylase [Bryobacteraceae bacterium]